MNQTPFDMAEIQQAPQHPAKYTDALLPVFARAQTATFAYRMNP